MTAKQVSRENSLYRIPGYSDIKFFLDSLETVRGQQKLMYVSSPISGGSNLLALVHKYGINGEEDLRSQHPKDFKENVVDQNLKQAHALVGALRERYHTYPSYIVLDPTQVSIPKWNSADYMKLWSEVLVKKISVMVMRNGWEYADGCVFECVLAFSSRIKVVDEAEKPLTVDAVLKLVKEARNVFSEVGLQTKFYDTQIKRLKKLILEQEIIQAPDFFMSGGVRISKVPMTRYEAIRGTKSDGMKGYHIATRKELEAIANTNNEIREASLTYEILTEDGLVSFHYYEKSWHMLVDASTRASDIGWVVWTPNSFKVTQLATTAQRKILRMER